MGKIRSDQPLSPATRGGGRERPPERITSAGNPAIKTLKSLQSKKGRAETGLFLAEGARLAAEAAELGHWPEILAFSESALERPAVRRLIGDALGRGVRCIETTQALLAQITKRDNAQTVVGAWRSRFCDLDALGPGSAGLIVALEGVRDPGNLGTIVRTADAAGAGGVVLVGQPCDPFSVEAVRATMGSIFAIPIVRADFAALDAWRRARGLALIGASLNGAALPEGQPGPAVALMGNEQSGLPQEMEAACDHLVRLPMAGRADSLNLASATAILVYDLWRRRSYAGARP